MISQISVGPLIQSNVYHTREHYCQDVRIFFVEQHLNRLYCSNVPNNRVKYTQSHFFFLNLCHKIKTIRLIILFYISVYLMPNVRRHFRAKHNLLCFVWTTYNPGPVNFFTLIIMSANRSLDLF